MHRYTSPTDRRRTLRIGIVLAASTALISGVSIFVNSYAVKQLPDAALFTTLKNGVAALALVALLVAPTAGRRAVAARSPRQWGALALIGVVGGSVPFVLFFTGLAQASAPSAAFIHKTLFFWVALAAVPFLGERLGWAQIGAFGALLASQWLLVPPTGVTWGTGETMIAAATLLWAVEVILAKRLLASVPSQVVGAGRMGIGLVILVGYLAVAGKLGMVGGLSLAQWAWALGTGALLAGYVATWYAALKRAPASLVTAVLVAGAPITATLQLIANGTVPSMAGLAGEVLILLAVVALARAALRRLQPLEAAAASV